MKMTPELKKAKENMEPGKITSSGFLGEDTREIVDIIEKDEEIFKNIDLDIDEVCEKLQYYLEEGKKGLGEPITVDGKYTVKIDEARGFLPCPFEDGIFRKINATLINNENNEKIIYSELSLHLLKKHHFCQGYGSEFRIDPLIIKKIL